MHRRTGPQLRLASGQLAVIVLGFLAIGVALALPRLLPGYWIRVATGTAMLAVLGSAWNIITGFAGYPAFGNVAFFGLGAYVSAVSLTTLGANIPTAILASGVVCGLVCGLIGLPLMRLRGHYFAIATIGLVLLFREATLVIPMFNQHPGGTIIVPRLTGDIDASRVLVYHLFLGLLIATVTITAILDRSRFGLGLKLIRYDEDLAAVLGVPVIRSKVLAWAISAVIFGIAGATWVLWIGIVDAVSAYDLSLAIEYSVVALLGGLGSVFGPVIAGIAVGVLSEVVTAELNSVHLAVMGAIVMLATLFMPNGVAGLLRRRRANSEFEDV